ncbi:MAG: hypothetical protein JXQ27_00620 [Acidobacteria bacterium]|nr:hypothetical protein [Acidobacteriota bacterium]
MNRRVLVDCLLLTLLVGPGGILTMAAPSAAAGNTALIISTGPEAAAGQAQEQQEKSEEKTPPPKPEPIKPTKQQSIREQLESRQLPARLEGQARLIMDKPSPKEGNIYEFPITVDLKNVKFIVQDTQVIPGVLGAYTLGVKFDPQKVKVLDMGGGSTKEFAKRPIFTNLEKANASGLIRFSAVHTNSRTPAGRISVATIKLEISDPQAVDSVELYGDSLSTSILFFPEGKIVGPFSIPFEGKQLPRRTVPQPKK